LYLVQNLCDLSDPLLFLLQDERFFIFSDQIKTQSNPKKNNGFNSVVGLV